MRVDPVLVGAAQLDIDKLFGRMPALNLALPGEGDAEETQPVRDACPLTEMDGLRRHDLEPQLGRGNPLQIGGLSEERKDPVTREWQRHRGRERVQHRPGHSV